MVTSGSGALNQRIAIRLYIFVEVEAGSRCHTNVDCPIVSRTVPHTEKNRIGVRLFRSIFALNSKIREELTVIGTSYIYER